MVKNTRILETKGLSLEEIAAIENVSLDTEQVILDELSAFTHNLPDEAIEKLVEKLDFNYKLKRRMHAISPIEGRYDRYVEGLHDVTSEFAFSKRRVMIEVEYLIALNKELHNNYEGKRKKIIPRELKETEVKSLRDLYRNFSEDDFRRIQLLDRKVQHDVVATTTWMVYELGDSIEGIEDQVEASTHFGLTSNDINQNVYNLIVMDIVKDHYLPAILELQETLIKKAEESPEVIFAGQTHGQFAEYTTLMKVFANFVNSISESLEHFTNNQKLPGKILGAVGNNNDLDAAFPDYEFSSNPLSFPDDFIEDLGLEPCNIADQPLSNIKNQQLYDNIRNLNTSLTKVCSDFWKYCSRGLFRKLTKKGESGSSVMAQKANPWLSEGAQEALSEANDSFAGYERMLTYRMQGDLRRSYHMRSIGEPFAKTIIGIRRLTQELNKYEANKEAIEDEVNAHPEMSAAAVQTILRRQGIPDAYDTLKDMTMGRRIERSDYNEFFESLLFDKKITKTVHKEFQKIILPMNNVGYANQYANEALMEAKQQIKQLKNNYEMV